ncbi:MAG TPA: hypothetical protein ENG03_04035 [Thioploca sp.]|nr:hypothetical protein [Thioploca sp.]
MAYYATGELFCQRTLVNGLREGLEVETKAERNYQNGKKVGSAKVFHSNDQLQGDWIFANGKPVSATIFYCSGEKWLVHTDFDDKGRLNGSVKSMINNDMVKRERVPLPLR